MHNQRLSKTPSSINTNSQAAEQNPKSAHRPFGSQIQKASVAPVTQSTKEDVAFAEQKMEAFGLELQAKYGKITPEGQERLTVLQAKMDGLLNSQLQHARRFSHNIANIPLTRPDTPIQAKLTIGEPGDKYEQEADETARQVVQRIHQPQSDKLQRESLPDEEDELQMKPLGNIQRESLPDEKELQMKPMVQRVSDGGIAATQDLEASINQARGGGQPLAKNIREPMEQGFGADFSRVKVHTDTQSDQLNRAIQAKAFTTGQDVFFRQGAYQPGSREGQELIAHELTHVVQQNGGAVQSVAKTQEKAQMHLKQDNSPMVQCLKAEEFDAQRLNANGHTDRVNVLDSLLTAIRNNINSIDNTQWWSHVVAENHNATQPVGNASTFQGDTEVNIWNSIANVIRTVAPRFSNSVLVFDSVAGGVCNGMHRDGKRTNIRVILDVNALTDETPFGEQLDRIIVTNAYPIV